MSKLIPTNEPIKIPPRGWLTVSNPITQTQEAYETRINNIYCRVFKNMGLPKYPWTAQIETDQVVFSSLEEAINYCEQKTL